MPFQHSGRLDGPSRADLDATAGDGPRQAVGPTCGAGIAAPGHRYR